MGVSSVTPYSRESCSHKLRNRVMPLDESGVTPMKRWMSTALGNAALACADALATMADLPQPEGPCTTSGRLPPLRR